MPNANPREDQMPNPFVHIELATDNVPAAKTFYGSMFGWTMTDVEMGGGFVYTMIDTGAGPGGGPGGGMFPKGPGMHADWLPYVLVDDVAAALAKAVGLGATVIRDVTQVANTGVLAIVADPTGAAIGFWQPKQG
jgi:predicted enzyme related to lactoylglutathione lyase